MFNTLSDLLFKYADLSEDIGGFANGKTKEFTFIWWEPAEKLMNKLLVELEQLADDIDGSYYYCNDWTVHVKFGG